MCGHRFELWLEGAGAGGADSDHALDCVIPRERGHYHEALTECAERAREHAKSVVYEADCSGLGASFNPWRVCDHCQRQGVVDNSSRERCWLCEHAHQRLAAVVYREEDFQ